ncbi:MAG: hypothetical protein IJE91_04280 [Clostridia bacterium]|nr:hypothetical protein [Clostridia bacterium]
MNKIKEALLRLKYPTMFFTIMYTFFALIVIAGTVTLVALGFSTEFWIYPLYIISASALTYLVYLVVYYAPKIKQNIVNSLKKHNFTNELLESYGFRSVIFAMFSFIINIAYAIFQGTIAILAGSIWYGALAVYYIVISCIRGGIVGVSRKRKHEEYPLDKQIKSYRNCGIYLILLNGALIPAIFQMVQQNQSFEYAGLMIYAMAAYAFYKLGMSIYNLIKAKQHNDYTIQSIKNISFADALVSILALQTALLQTFGGGFNPAFANALTGGSFSIIIIAIGVIMIILGQKELNKLKNEHTNEK